MSSDTLLTFTRGVTTGGDTKRCQIMDVPFATGGIRLAFYARVRGGAFVGAWV